MYKSRILQMSVLYQYFTSLASVASWLWLLNISRHVSCQFGSIYHGSKLEQGGREQIASSSKMFQLFLFGRTRDQSTEKSVMPS